MTIADPDLLSGRLFYGLAVPSRVRGPLEAAVGRLEQLLPGAAFAAPAGWHVTLAFLGHVRPELADEVVTVGERAAATSPRLRLSLAGCGAFPSATRARVLWVGLDGDAAATAALSGALTEASREAGLRWDERPFRGHLTLARLRKPAPVSDEVLALGTESAAASPGWEAAELCCFRSTPSKRGMRYEIVRRFPLGS